MRHRDFLLRLLDTAWLDYDTRRGMSHSNADYAHYAERQKWIDEIRDDLRDEALAEAEREAHPLVRVATEPAWCDRASECSHQHIVAVDSPGA